MSIKFHKRFYAQTHNLSNPIQKFPWNFYAVPERREVGNLTSAVPIEKLLSYKKIVSIYKQFIESIEHNDSDLLSSISEPYFCQEAEKAIQNLHTQQNLKLEVENLRSFKSPDVFLYDVKNFLLVGTDVPEVPLSLNRLTNLPELNYILSHDEEIFVKQISTKNRRATSLDQIQNVPVPVTTITQNTTKVHLKADTKINFVSRLYFMIHSYINIFGVDTQSGQTTLGQQLPENLVVSNQGAHFMTLDKIVQEMTVQDLQIQSTTQEERKFNEEKSRKVPKSMIKSFDKSYYISDFDFFMANGNPIVG